MTPLTQVAHVLSKDVRQLRWPLSAYLALVAVATAHTVVWPTVRNGLLDSIMLLVVSLGMIVAALLVQTDSPIRADAYWASRPLAPWAVLGAKVAGALLLVLGLGLVGQFLGLRAYDVSPRAIPGELAASARTYGLCLLVAMVLAALTRDFRSFVVAVVAVPIVLLILGTTVFSTVFDHAERYSTGWLVGSVAVIGGGALLMFVYRTRYNRRPIWAPGFIVASCGLVSLLGPPSAPSAKERMGPRPAAEAPITLQMNNDAPRGFDARGPALTVSVAPAPGTGELVLANPTVTLHLRDGSSVGASVDMPTLDLYAPHPSLGQGESWIGGGQPESRSQSFTVRPHDPQRDALAVGIASIDLDGQMVVQESHVIGSLRLATGARLTHEGTRVAIEHWSRSPSGPVIAVRVSSVTPDEPVPGRAVFGMNAAGREFALLNPRRREALALVSRAMNGGGGPLVLPGPNMMNASLTLTTSQSRAGGSAPLAPDAEWLRDARLIVVRWRPVGQYPVHVSTRVR